jgi:hypothetical protein
MGHIAGKEEILKQLRKRLHQNPIGLPEHPSVYEILAIFLQIRKLKWVRNFLLEW